MRYYRRRYKARGHSFRSYEMLSDAQKLRNAASKKATDFVVSKFRQLSPDEFNSYSSWYQDQHGKNAHSYFLKSYDSWRHGSKGMSPQTSSRVLAGVPRIMSRSEQYQLIKIYLPSLLFTPLEFANGASISSGELNDTYSGIARRLMSHQFHLDWFASGIFSQSEIEGFHNVIRFILMQRLEWSYSDTVSDLVSLHNLLRTLDAEVCLQYQVNYLGVKIAISDVHEVLKKRVEIAIPPLSTENASHPELRAILADTTLTDSMKYQLGAGVQLLAINDVANTVAQMASTKDDQEWDSEIVVEGRGGIAQINIVKISIPLLKKRIIINYCWIIITIAGMGLAAKLLWGSRKGYGGFLFFIALFGIGWLVSLISEVREHNATIERYRQRKSRVFVAK